MKRTLLCLVACVMLFAACKQDPGYIETPDNNFTYNDKYVPIWTAYLLGPRDGKLQLSFANADYYDVQSLTMLTMANITIDTLITGQTYTFMRRDSSAFDRTKNFASAFVAYQQPWTNFEMDSAAVLTDSLISGSLTLREVEDLYNIVFQLKFPKATVNGEFNGYLSYHQ